MREDFVAFVDAEYHHVVRFMMRTGASLEEAKDATQHAFERGWIKVLAYQWPQLTNPRAWIRTVALHHHRRRPQTVQLPGWVDEDAAPGPGHAELTSQALDVMAILDLVADELARMVLAYDLDDIPGPAIATALDLTEQQVRDLRKKARRTLKQQLPRPATTERRDSP